MQDWSDFLLLLTLNPNPNPNLTLHIHSLAFVIVPEKFSANYPQWTVLLKTLKFRAI